MSLGKKYIIKDISAKTQLTYKTSSSLFNSFISIIANKEMDVLVKISNFGTFTHHFSPARIGRNPKTKELFKISNRLKLKFRPSSAIKVFLN
jgi:nucleoid DNA-binding protein